MPLAAALSAVPYPALLGDALAAARGELVHLQAVVALPPASVGSAAPGAVTTMAASASHVQKWKLKCRRWQSVGRAEA